MISSAEQLEASVRLGSDGLLSIVSNCSRAEEAPNRLSRTYLARVWGQIVGKPTRHVSQASDSATFRPKTDKRALPLTAVLHIRLMAASPHPTRHHQSAPQMLHHSHSKPDIIAGGLRLLIMVLHNSHYTPAKWILRQVLRPASSPTNSTWYCRNIHIFPLFLIYCSTRYPLISLSIINPNPGKWSRSTIS